MDDNLKVIVPDDKESSGTCWVQNGENNGKQINGSMAVFVHSQKLH
jgi:hypothetical protein